MRKRDIKGRFVGKLPVSKKCLYCQRVFSSFVSQKRKFCSRGCKDKGQDYSHNIRHGFKKGYNNLHKGDSTWVNSGTFKAGHKGLAGENNPAWKDGMTFRKRKWLKSVFKRDNYICQMCFKRGGSLAGHHILPQADFPGFKFMVKNGITLCNPCHKKIFGKEWLYVSKFLGI